jgi:hypothetical protein
MKISSLAGSIALFDIMSRHGAALVQEKPRVHREPKMAKVNTSQAKEKSGTSTDNNQDSTRKVNRTRPG